MNTVRRQHAQVVQMCERVGAAEYTIPARVRLLDAMNDLLKPITTLETLDHEGTHGLTYREWLFAFALRRQVLMEANELDT